jgi:hypothetical protein
MPTIRIQMAKIDLARQAAPLGLWERMGERGARVFCSSCQIYVKRLELPMFSSRQSEKCSIHVVQAHARDPPQ